LGTQIVLGLYDRPAKAIIKHNTKFSYIQPTKDLRFYDHTSHWLVRGL
jgi:hypothetical protein